MRAALALDGQGRETSTLARINPSAALLVTEARLRDAHNRGVERSNYAFDWAGRTARTTNGERALLTEAIELVSLDTAPGAAGG